jgi:hypothetical protein
LQDTAFSAAVISNSHSYHAGSKLGMEVEVFLFSLIGPFIMNDVSLCLSAYFRTAFPPNSLRNVVVILCGFNDGKLWHKIFLFSYLCH